MQSITIVNVSHKKRFARIVNETTGEFISEFKKYICIEFWVFNVVFIGILTLIPSVLIFHGPTGLERVPEMGATLSLASLSIFLLNIIGFTVAVEKYYYGIMHILGWLTLVILYPLSLVMINCVGYGIVSAKTAIFIWITSLF